MPQPGIAQFFNNLLSGFGGGAPVTDGRALRLSAAGAATALTALARNRPTLSPALTALAGNANFLEWAREKNALEAQPLQGVTHGTPPRPAYVINLAALHRAALDYHGHNNDSPEAVNAIRTAATTLGNAQLGGRRVGDYRDALWMEIEPPETTSIGAGVINALPTIGMGVMALKDLWEEGFSFDGLIKAILKLIVGAVVSLLLVTFNVGDKLLGLGGGGIAAEPSRRPTTPVSRADVVEREVEATPEADASRRSFMRGLNAILGVETRLGTEAGTVVMALPSGANANDMMGRLTATRNAIPEAATMTFRRDGNTIIIGGLGNDAANRRFLQDINRTRPVPVMLDADGNAPPVPRIPPENIGATLGAGAAASAGVTAMSRGIGTATDAIAALFGGRSTTPSAPPAPPVPDAPTLSANEAFAANLASVLGTSVTIATDGPSGPRLSVGVPPGMNRADVGNNIDNALRALRAHGAGMTTAEADAAFPDLVFRNDGNHIFITMDDLNRHLPERVRAGINNPRAQDAMRNAVFNPIAAADAWPAETRRNYAAADLERPFLAQMRREIGIRGNGERMRSYMSNPWGNVLSRIPALSESSFSNPTLQLAVFENTTRLYMSRAGRNMTPDEAAQWVDVNLARFTTLTSPGINPQARQTIVDLVRRTHRQVAGAITARFGDVDIRNDSIPLTAPTPPAPPAPPSMPPVDTGRLDAPAETMFTSLQPPEDRVVTALRGILTTIPAFGNLHADVQRNAIAIAARTLRQPANQTLLGSAQERDHRTLAGNIGRALLADTTVGNAIRAEAGTNNESLILNGVPFVRAGMISQITPLIRQHKDALLQALQTPTAAPVMEVMNVPDGQNAIFNHGGVPRSTHNPLPSLPDLA